MTETIAAQVRVNLIGTSPAVADFGGVLISGVIELEIEALPTDLPESLDVDISGLEKIGDSILVRDLEVSDKLVILTDPGSMLAVAAAPAAEIVDEVEVDELLEGEEGEEGVEGAEGEEGTEETEE
jgi:large subunit ribosomal protein L25